MSSDTFLIFLRRRVTQRTAAKYNTFLRLFRRAHRMTLRPLRYLTQSIPLILILLSACIKTPIDFGSTQLSSDPNIRLIDTLTVDVSTLQLDSFLTRNTKLFIVGRHHDPAFGIVEARAYFEITAPANELANCSKCVFDSIELRTKINGGFFGDTSELFTFSIYGLSQLMDEDLVSVGYNTSNIALDPVPIVSQTISIRPSRKADLKVRMPASFGQRFFDLLKRNSDTVTNSTMFLNYSKGLCLVGSSSSNAIYYLSPYDSLSSVIRLHYTIAGASPEPKYVDFKMGNSQHQFNSFNYDRTGTALEVFSPKRRQIKNSALLGNQGFMHINSGLFPKITLSNLWSIKELYPYIKVIKAELEMRPAAGTYGYATFYSLPPQLNLYPIDVDEVIVGNAISGNLFIDDLYGKDTKYTYDITAFVNAVLDEGRASKKALLLKPPDIIEDQRLVFNDKTGPGPIVLKLYILGL